MTDCLFNSLTPVMGLNCKGLIFQKIFMNDGLIIRSQLDTTGHNWWQVNVGLGNDLLSDGIK